MNRIITLLFVIAVAGLATECQAQLLQNRGINYHRPNRQFQPGRPLHSVRPFHGNRPVQSHALNANHAPTNLQADAARNYHRWRNSERRNPETRNADIYNFYDVSNRYPKYYGAFHSSHFSNIGIPSGDRGFRGNGIYWTPW